MWIWSSIGDYQLRAYGTSQRERNKRCCRKARVNRPLGRQFMYCGSAGETGEVGDESVVCEGVWVHVPKPQNEKGCAAVASEWW